MEIIGDVKEGKNSIPGHKLPIIITVAIEVSSRQYILFVTINISVWRSLML